MSAGAGTAQDDAQGAIVLDTMGYWRVFHVLSPPMIERPGGPQPVLAIDQKWLHETTSRPPDDWRSPDFDDSSWLHGPARIACDAPMVERICLRGKFIVDDPAKVKTLKLSAGYYGGAILCLNGTELRRGQLKTGEEGRLGLADSYPDEAYYFGSTGTWDYLTGGKADEMDRIRTRRLDDVSVVRELLRKGVNVVTVEIVRAPYDAVVEKGTAHKRRTPCQLNWSTCAVRDVQLTAADAAGIVPRALRPRGLQVWNSGLMSSDFTLDFGDTAEPMRPVEIVAARNGWFNGKVVVGCDEALKGLKVTIGDLAGPGTIAASAVEIRYAMPWGEEADCSERYAVEPATFGALFETPPDEIPVRTGRTSWRNRRPALTPDPVFGAVVPVWLTVAVPADAKPGDYRGTLTIRADGHKPVSVPVRLSVEDFTLPDPQDYTTWVELIESPDTLVVEYGLKMWSDEHFALMAKSMRFLNRIGSRLLYIPAICHTNHGNAESMIRWIEKPDGTYDWDFSIMDRYLDLAEKEMGRPKVVCFWVWDKFLFPTVDDPKTYEQYSPGRRVARVADGPDDYIGRGPIVTVLDPKTGKTQNQYLPYLLDPRSREIWKPLFDELRKRMAKRSLADAMVLGTPSDVVMRKDHFDFFKDVAPGLTWVNHSHFDLTKLYEANGGELGYYTSVMNVLFPGYPEEGRHYGWKNPKLHAHLRSRWGRDYFPLTTWRHLAEINITGEQRGVGRVGADFWKAVKDKRGNRTGYVFSRYPEAGWRSNDLCSAVLAPGPDGPVAEVRYEMMREGVQECEARIVIERALTDDALRARLGDDLAKRCQDALDERLRFMIKGMCNLTPDSYIPGWSTNATLCWWNNLTIQGHRWFIASGWEDRTRKLFELAGEVQRKVGG